MTKKKTTGNNDEDLFRQLMSDVKPLAAEPRITPVKVTVSPHPKTRDDDQRPATHFIERENVTATTADELLHFSRDGLQQRQLQRLQQGEISAESKLDLHGHTITEAGSALNDFLQDAQQTGRRCVLIVHGKGYRSGQPVLKTQLNHWLRDEPRVLAFHSAQPRHGGAGALYVLLRRNR